MDNDKQELAKHYIRKLEKVSNEDNGMRGRIAYLEYHLLRRLVEDVTGWPDIIKDMDETVALIEREQSEGRY